MSSIAFRRVLPSQTLQPIRLGPSAGYGEPVYEPAGHGHFCGKRDSRASARGNRRQAGQRHVGECSCVCVGGFWRTAQWYIFLRTAATLIERHKEQYLQGDKMDMTTAASLTRVNLLTGANRRLKLRKESIGATVCKTRARCGFGIAIGIHVSYPWIYLRLLFVILGPSSSRSAFPSLRARTRNLDPAELL